MLPSSSYFSLASSNVTCGRVHSDRVPSPASCLSLIPTWHSAPCADSAPCDTAYGSSPFEGIKVLQAVDRSNLSLCQMQPSPQQEPLRCLTSCLGQSTVLLRNKTSYLHKHFKSKCSGVFHRVHHETIHSVCILKCAWPASMCLSLLMLQTTHLTAHRRLRHPSKPNRASM